MDAAQTIRTAIAGVFELRTQSGQNPALHEGVVAVKGFQARRFSHSYADLLGGGPYQGAARFFLDELYSDKDFSSRDAQFSRIAKALQTFFPKPVVATAVSLAQLHALTESLDHDMGLAWAQAAADAATATSLAPGFAPDPAQVYVTAWRRVGRYQDRQNQLQTVLAVGQELDKLTRAPGLRLMLKMMRKPAASAGLSALQTFLENGFDTFANMAGRAAGARAFLALIEQRESALIARLSSTQALDGVEVG